MHSLLGYQPLTFVMMQTTSLATSLLRSESNRDHSKMKNESVKKSIQTSKNLLEEKHKMVNRKIGIKKTNISTKSAMNFIQEQLIKKHSQFLKNHKTKLETNSKTEKTRKT